MDSIYCRSVLGLYGGRDVRGGDHGGGALMSQVLARRSTGALSKYDPQKGVKVIAALEMAEKHFAKAKDATQLERAIRAKLEAQAEFVFWWDTKGPGANHGGARTSGKIADRKSWNGLSVDPVTVHRWRRKLNDPATFEATFTEACARYVKILELQSTAHIGQNTGETEWFTPAAYVEAARAVLGAFDLDPASTPAANTVVKAERIYTVADNGLAQPWNGRVWMNPPYSQPLIDQFATKLASAFTAADVTEAIALVNNATETGWFRTLADVAAAVCFPQGRIQFWHPTKDKAAPLQGQALLYLGRSPAIFRQYFDPLGTVWVKP